MEVEIIGVGTSFEMH